MSLTISLLLLPFPSNQNSGAPAQRKSSPISSLFLHFPCKIRLGSGPLVLNLGGLLYQNTRSRKDIPAILPHDFSYGKRIVFKRPFYEEFLEFCFERFDVGIWSSLQSQNFEVVLENIMGESKSKLKFAWHQGHCTMPGFKWKNSERKPLFLKDLEKLGAEPKLSSHFSLSNTLLIDNEPYKALLNPQNTAIFPYPYKVSNVKDTFLGPEGELQVFLDGLANAEDVPSYVKENRIGQPALTSSHPDWGYYSDMLKSLQGENTYIKFLKSQAYNDLISKEGSSQYDFASKTQMRNFAATGKFTTEQLAIIGSLAATCLPGHALVPLP